MNRWLGYVPQIGSGFDVSAACFGSQSYTRFPLSVLDTFTSEDAIEPERIALCITDHALWNTSDRVVTFAPHCAELTHSDESLCRRNLFDCLLPST